MARLAWQLKLKFSPLLMVDFSNLEQTKIDTTALYTIEI